MTTNLNAMNQENCPVCNTTLSVGLTTWHRHCPSCRYEKADLGVSINDSTVSANIDESSRADALEGLRKANFNQILNTIATYKTGGRLLDVGAAHGWFLDLAKTKFDALGIEPDQKIANESIARGCNIKVGYFPQVLSATETFDVIIFNDVTEHIPDITQVLKDCKAHLNIGGLLVINLPSSDGVFYRLSQLLYKIGMPASFERMWQKGLPSPHLHYFNHKNLVRLLISQELNVLQSQRLDSIKLSGLYTRLTYAKNKQSRLKNSLMFCVIAIVIPFLRILPSDIIYVVARKNS